MNVKVDAMGLKADVLGSVKIHKATDSNTVRGSRCGFIVGKNGLTLAIRN